MSASTADELVDHLLQVARERLGMELSWLSSFTAHDQVFDRFSGPALQFGLGQGSSSPYCDSYCARVIDGRLPNLIPDTAAHPVTAALSVTEKVGIGSYIGVPIRRIDGSPRGMLCCINSGDAHHLGESDVHTLTLLAELLGEIVNSASPAARRDAAVFERVEQAMEQRQFRTVYQPIVDIATGRAIGVEALSRFDAPPSRPNVWFAEAASVGLGIDLELAAIETALAGLPDLDRELYLTVNASPAAASDPRLVEIIKSSTPERIVIELTEHAAISSYEALTDALDTFRSLKVRIAVDDAGAGFSSLSHVLEIRPSILKIDRSIVKGIHLDPARASLVQTIVDVATRLDAAIIAEGVEHQEELDSLGSLGVPLAQGYLIARPGPLPTSLEPTCRAIVAEPSNESLRDNHEEDVGLRRFELAMLHSPVGMAIVSPTGAFLHNNPAFSAILGYTTNDIRDRSFNAVLPREERDEAARLLAECLQGARTSYRADRLFKKADGTTIWCELSTVLIRSEGKPTYFIAQLQDATERRAREEELARLARTDHLTDLANRSAARQHLEGLMGSQTPFAVMFCDLRSFKGINDRYGHRAGDFVLETVAHRLSSAVRNKDIVSRWGGDEFLLILEGASQDLLATIRHRVATEVAQPIELPDQGGVVEPHITVGLATKLADCTTSIDQLLHQADSDMYRQREVSLVD